MCHLVKLFSVKDNWITTHNEIVIKVNVYMMQNHLLG